MQPSGELAEKPVDLLPVRLVDGQTICIPNTVAIIKGMDAGNMKVGKDCSVYWMELFIIGDRVDTCH